MKRRLLLRSLAGVSIAPPLIPARAADRSAGPGAREEALRMLVEAARRRHDQTFARGAGVMSAESVA